eukprot:3829124-Pyramimonas_sp.AAC.1
MPWVKVYLYGSMDFARAQYRPVPTVACAGDITQTQQGAWPGHVSSAEPAAVHLCHQLGQVGATISGMSIFVRYDRRLLGLLTTVFRASSLSITVVDGVRDVEVMATAGRSRCVSKLRQRRAMARRKALRPDSFAWWGAPASFPNLLRWRLGRGAMKFQAPPRSGPVDASPGGYVLWMVEPWGLHYYCFES